LILPWVALKKPPRKAPTPLMRWREAYRDHLLSWTAGALGVALLLVFWFAVAKGIAR
jgi:hypothetical protein